MRLILLQILAIWNFVNCQSNGNEEIEGMGLVGLSLEAFNPCPDGIITMEREVGRAPSEENYWNGTFHLTQYKNLPEARIDIELDSPAVLTVDPNIARVYARRRTFNLTPFYAKDDIKFVVQGVQGRDYPNIVRVTLNGKSICKNPTKVTPTLLGREPVALSAVTISPEDFVPFCGRPQKDHTALIVNAEDTKPGDWPWHIALYSIDKNNNSVRNYICGGSIISKRSIVTAAHCVTGSNGVKVSAAKLLVVAGIYRLKGRDSSIQELQVSEILVNSEYNIDNLKSDIAIIHVTNEIEFNLFVQPVCLWNDYDSNRNTLKDLIYGLNGTIVGWGLNENDTLSDKLGSGELTIISDVNCLLSYPTFFTKFINKNSICAGNEDKITNPCNGDSGGGLVMSIKQPDNKSSYFLRGIVSVTVSRTDKKVCDPNYYTVFTDAAQFTDWLRNNI